MEKWYADFKESCNVKTIFRSKWDNQRDLVIDSFDARDKEHARVVAFEIANKHLDRPYMGTLKKLGIEEKPVIQGTKRPNVGGPVLNLLQERANKTVTIEQLVKATGFNEKQVRNAISHAVNRGYDAIEVLIRGRAWRWNEIEANGNSKVYKPEDTTKPEVVQQVEAYVNEPSDDEKGFYLLNTAKDGGLILQRDCDGTIWKAERL